MQTPTLTPSMEPKLGQNFPSISTPLSSPPFPLSHFISSLPSSHLFLSPISVPPLSHFSSSSLPFQFLLSPIQFPHSLTLTLTPSPHFPSSLFFPVSFFPFFNVYEISLHSSPHSSPNLAINLFCSPSLSSLLSPLSSLLSLLSLFLSRITSSPVADIFIVWARCTEDMKVRGFILEKVLDRHLSACCTSSLSA